MFYYREENPRSLKLQAVSSSSKELLSFALNSEWILRLSAGLYMDI